MEYTVTRTALLSQIAVLAGSVCYAVAAIIADHRPSSDALVAAPSVTVIASMEMGPTAILSVPPSYLDLSAAEVAAVAVLGVMSTALATVVCFKLIAVAEPSFLSLINYLIPLRALLLGMIALDESPEWTALGALVLVLLGIALSERERPHVEST